MVEKTGANATSCPGLDNWTEEKKLFTGPENFFRAGEEKSAGFSFRKEQILLEMNGRLCYSMNKSMRRTRGSAGCAGLAIVRCTKEGNICCVLKILFGQPDFT